MKSIWIASPAQASRNVEKGGFNVRNKPHKFPEHHLACSFLQVPGGGINSFRTFRPQRREKLKKLAFLISLLLLAIPTTFAHAISLGQGSDATTDSRQANDALELVKISGELDDSDMLILTVTLNGEFSLTEPQSSDIKLTLDVNADSRADYFVTLRSFELFSPFSGADYIEGDSALAVFDSRTGLPSDECTATPRVTGDKVTFEIFSLACFGNPNQIGYQFQSLSDGKLVDQAPNSGFLKASTDIRKLTKCSKDTKAELHTLREQVFMCMLLTGTLTKGTWGLVRLVDVSPTNFLKMYPCSRNQKDATIALDKPGLEKLWQCVEKSGKWNWVDGKTLEAQNKALQAAARAKLVANARHLPAKAYYACKLDSASKRGATLGDGGKTLILDRRNFRVTNAEYLCTTRYLKMPLAVTSKIGSTRALDGTLAAKWGTINAFWNYHPDSGLQITFTTLR
jgi:hypothetical protein